MPSGNDLLRVTAQASLQLRQNALVLQLKLPVLADTQWNLSKNEVILISFVGYFKVFAALFLLKMWK